MAYPIEAPFGRNTYAQLGQCAGCGKRYDGADSEWTTTLTTKGSMNCWLLFCMDCARKMMKEDGDE